MRFKRYKLENNIPMFNVTPTLNIIFLLFMFCLLTFPLTQEKGIQVNLPKAVTSDVIQEGIFVITITSEDIIYWGGKITTLKELSQNLIKSENKDQSLLIKADRRASIGRIVDVWSLCRNLGINKINIATNQEIR